MSRAAVLLIVAAGTACVPTFAPAQPVTMDQLWPNQDGRSWSYLQHYEAYGIVPQVVDNQVRLIFDGTTTAPTAIECQYLRHELLSGPAVALLASNEEITDPFMRTLSLARPDLRDQIRSTLAGSPCPENGPPGRYALFLNGEFAWRRTADEVSAWRCNLPDTRSWQWLASNLTIGSEFTLQLVPDLASNVFLHGTIGAVESATVPAGTFPGCVRVDYVVDYGESICTDDNGTPIGTFRSETRGSVHYAPDEGPVKSFEEFIPVAIGTGSCGSLTGVPASRTTLQLASPSVPVRPATWGALKLRYR